MATINIGDTVYDANPNDNKILVKIPYTALADGYYLVRYRALPGAIADTNTAISSVTYVLKGQPNYVLVPRKFSNLAYDYFIMKYEAVASASGSLDTNDRVTTNEADLAEIRF